MAYFIDPSSEASKILNSIVDKFGENFKEGYDGTRHPNLVDEANEDFLLQYDIPAGSKMQGNADPSKGGSIGSSIQSLLMLLAPFISAYSLILPILGIIRGIIEIICAMMNPFAVIAAVIKLFVKWLPPFISLFPPSGGIVLLMSTIKAIIALVNYIMTEVVPVIQLIITNVETIVEMFETPDDVIQIKLDTIEFKMKNLIKMLIQKIGIMGTFKPILDILFLILKLLAGFPCGSGEGADTGLGFPNVPGPDSTCCGEFCPDILSFRDKAPQGLGVMIQADYGDCLPILVYQIVTTNPDVTLLEPFQESLQEQMFCQMDESVKYAQAPGATQNRALLKITITDLHNGQLKITAPVLDITDTTIKLISPLANIFDGQLVKYEFNIDYDMMVMQSIIGVACHPDVRVVKDNMEAKFALPPVFDANPEAASIADDYGDVNSGTIALMNSVVNVIDGISTQLPPHDDKIAALNAIQNEAVALLSGYSDDLIDIFGSLLGRNTDNSASTFTVNKNVATADGLDFALVTVFPRDITGTLIAQASPPGVEANVEVLSDFGVVSNKVFSNADGIVTAELRSSEIGAADVTVKVNNELLTTFNAQSTPSEILRVETVNFTADAILPTRRRRSKPSSGKAVTTGTTSEKEPGSK